MRRKWRAVQRRAARCGCSIVALSLRTGRPKLDERILHPVFGTTGDLPASLTAVAQSRYVLSSESRRGVTSEAMQI